MLHQVIFHQSLKKVIISLQKGQTRWQRQKLIDFILYCKWKAKFLGTSSGGIFRTPSDRISHCICIFWTSSCQLRVISEISYLFAEVVYWPCDLKFVYPTINLAFLRIIVNVNLPAKFCLEFWMILSPNYQWPKILFPHLSKALWSRIKTPTIRPLASHHENYTS